MLRKNKDETMYLTDNGNPILDACFGGPCIQNPEEICKRLQNISGVLEVGLFVGMADLAIVAGPPESEEKECVITK